MSEQPKRTQRDQPQPYDLREDADQVGGAPDEAREEGLPPGGDVREAYSSDRVEGDVEPEDAQPT